MEDQLALKKVEQSLKCENGKYQVAIPGKNNEPMLFNNYDMAFRRLQNTEKRLSEEKKNVELEGVYSDIIDQYIQKGYIRKVEEEEKRPHKAWYLPHFPVLCPDKPTTKTRIVFASAKENGVSLNDEIHQGPKLQRFLWRSMEEDKSPDEYEFNCVVFGINSSPFHAQYVVQQHVNELQQDYPMAAETVKDSTYMDDSMDSVLTDGHGIELYHQC